MAAYQTFTYIVEDIGFGPFSGYTALGCHPPGGTQVSVFGTSAIKIPMPCAGTFRNFAAYSYSIHPALICGLIVNDVLTPLQCTVPLSAVAAGSYASNKTDSVDVVAGDLIFIAVNPGVNLGIAGRITVSFAIEFEGEGGKQFFSNTGLGIESIAGAFGAGVTQHGPSIPTVSNTATYCATPGSITRLYVKSVDSTIPVGTSVYTAWIRKNGINQDGTGGTVDTTVVINAAHPIANFKDFNLHFNYLDYADVVCGMTFTGSGRPVIAASIVWEPDDPNTMMFCGGNNISVGNYNWTTGLQNGNDENPQQSIIPIRGFELVKAWVKRSSIGSPGGASPHTLRKNQLDTSLSVLITNALTAPGEHTEEVTGSVTYVEGNFIDWGMTYVGAVGLGQMHWAMTAKPSVLTPVDLSGIYFINPNKLTGEHDSYYSNIEKKIPDPTIKTALIGE